MTLHYHRICGLVSYSVSACVGAPVGRTTTTVPKLQTQNYLRLFYAYHLRVRLKFYANPTNTSITQI